jgi:hypothetical protein
LTGEVIVTWTSESHSSEDILDEGYRALERTTRLHRSHFDLVRLDDSPTFQVIKSPSTRVRLFTLAGDLVLALPSEQRFFGGNATIFDVLRIAESETLIFPDCTMDQVWTDCICDMLWPGRGRLTPATLITPQKIVETAAIRRIDWYVRDGERAGDVGKLLETKLKDAPAMMRQEDASGELCILFADAWEDDEIQPQVHFFASRQDVVQWADLDDLDYDLRSSSVRGSRGDGSGFPWEEAWANWYTYSDERADTLLANVHEVESDAETH